MQRENNIKFLPFTIRDLDEAIQGGYITRRKHPEFPISIYNYTAKTMYENHWTAVTRTCRGLILHNDTFEIIARPFPKFWELDPSRLEGVPPGDPEIWEKVDGSLGIRYVWKGEQYIATRGSFTNPGALLGTGLLNRDYPKYAYSPMTTYLFEICDPSNTIVVKHEEARLVLIGVIDNLTSLEYSLDCFGASFRCPVKYNISIETALRLAKESKDPKLEGFVVNFHQNKRYKIKTDLYRKAHKIRGQLTKKTVWEVLSSGANLEDWLEDVPNEMQSQALAYRDELAAERIAVLENCMNVIKTQEGTTDEEVAAYVNKHKFPYVTFQIMKRAKVDRALWKAVKP